MTSVLDDWLQPRPGDGGGGVPDRLSLPRPAAGEQRDGGDDTGSLDAGLISTGSQTRFRERVAYGLRTALNAQAPGDLVAVNRMDVLLEPERRARPDVSLVDDLAASDDRRTCYLAEEVRLVIDIAGPDSAVPDRDALPRHYAAAGIPHFWRVESTGWRPFVYSYELDAAGAGYQVTGVHHTRLAVGAPFPVEIDLERLPR
ncbi:Uma2 family endonuclease [Microbispora sp. NPDC049633]|uniref:Uma2 family endonuclease n=1 Tax=Microbispora sp. NPDC049633 TaxID=3154355 RepID=UPI00343DFC04